MSIRSRLLLLVLLAVLLPTAFVGLRFVADRDSEIARAVDESTRTANDLAIALDEKIQGTAQLLYGLARARDLDTPDRAACSAFLSAVLEKYPLYTGILTIASDGRLFCDSLATGRELDLRDRRYFQEAVRPDINEVALQPAFGRLTGRSVLQIAMPARGPAAELRFVLLASLDLEKFVREWASRDAEILLMADDGTVLVWFPSQLRGMQKGRSLRGQPMFDLAASTNGRTSAELAGIDGDTQVWVVARLPALKRAGLHILVGQSKHVVVAEADSRFKGGMLLLAAVAALLFLGVWFLAEIGIRRPVARIGAMARNLGSGNLQARLPPPHPRGELGALSEVLNDTAASLERQRADIQELDRRLRQSQKMEAVGQLTGGVAHDFNNLLTVILGNAESLSETLAAHPDLKDMAGAVMSAAERGADLTRSLLAFARRQPLQPRPVDVNELVLRMEKLLRRTLGEHIEYRFVLAPALPPAMVDAGQLETALLNLALNARDAMPAKGRLTVETREVLLDAAYVAAHEDVSPGRYVMIAMADNGIGMSKETLAQVFEPFFTTKDVGKGTGLGLSMVYGFVKQSGGHVKIYSETGHGTIVKLYLPLAEATSPDSAAPPGAMVRGAGQTVLAVEDDDMVRAHVVRELEVLGYVPVAAADGAAALDIVRSGRVVDLLFTDVVMPGGMSGVQLAEKVRELLPGMKVLFTSGYTENVVLHHGRLDSGVYLLSKPSAGWSWRRSCVKSCRGRRRWPATCATASRIGGCRVRDAILEVLLHIVLILHGSGRDAADTH